MTHATYLYAKAGARCKMTRSKFKNGQTIWWNSGNVFIRMKIVDIQALMPRGNPIVHFIYTLQHSKKGALITLRNILEGAIFSKKDRKIAISHVKNKSLDKTPEPVVPFI